jgi:hypothetical protein
VPRGNTLNVILFGVPLVIAALASSQELARRTNRSRNHPARSPGRPQFHPYEALVEPRIKAQAVPLRRHGEVNQRRVARVDGALKMLESRVEVSSQRVVHHQSQSRVPTFGSCRAIREQFCRALPILDDQAVRLAEAATTVAADEFDAHPL